MCALGCGRYSVHGSYHDPWGENKNSGCTHKRKCFFFLFWFFNNVMVAYVIMPLKGFPPKRLFVTFFLLTGKMPAAEQGARAARPQQALGGCGGSTRKTPLASKCKSWEQTLCSCRCHRLMGSTASLPPVVLALMNLQYTQLRLGQGDRVWFVCISTN